MTQKSIREEWLEEQNQPPAGLEWGGIADWFLSKIREKVEGKLKLYGGHPSVDAVLQGLLSELK